MREVVRLKEELLELTKIKYEAGDVSTLEVNLAEVEASKVKSDLITVERSFGESRLSLQETMGAGTKVLPTIEGQLAPEIAVIPDKDYLKAVLEDRPDIKAAVVEIDRTNRVDALVWREAIPNPSLGGFYTRDEQRGEVGVILSVSIPIFDRKQAQKREARARMEQARIRRAGLGLAVEKEFEQEYMNLASSLLQLSIYKKEILAKSLENLDLLNLAFKEGKISFFDVRLAQRDAIDLRIAHLDTLLRAQQAIYGMERTIGGNLR
jgi:cobalt-zinc-cadmium efflux system outer membrane protein